MVYDFETNNDFVAGIFGGIANEVHHHLPHLVCINGGDDGLCRQLQLYVLSLKFHGVGELLINVFEQLTYVATSKVELYLPVFSLLEIKQLVGNTQQVVDVAPHGSDVVFDGGILCQLLTDSLHRKTDEGERSAYLVYDVDKESYLRLKVSLLLFGLECLKTPCVASFQFIVITALKEVDCGSKQQ